MESINLESERLILRKLKMEDAEKAFQNWTSDPDVSRYVRWSTHKTIDDTIEYLKKVQDNYKNTKNYEWGIVLKDTDELIGAISAFESEDDRYEIGYNISKKYWRNGYTSEALKRVMNYLVDEVGIKKFMCSHAKLNPASGAVMKKVGFKYVRDTIIEKFDKTEQFDSKVYYLDIIKLVKPTKEY